MNPSRAPRRIKFSICASIIFTLFQQPSWGHPRCDTLWDFAKLKKKYSYVVRGSPKITGISNENGILHGELVIIISKSIKWPHLFKREERINTEFYYDKENECDILPLSSHKLFVLDRSNEKYTFIKSFN
jgi:hypothetical protein